MALGASLAFAPAVAADTIRVQPQLGCSIEFNHPYPECGTLHIGEQDPYGLQYPFMQRALVKYDLAAALPSGAVIESVELDPHIDYSDAVLSDLEVYRAHASWTDDVTWESRDGTAPWLAPSGYPGYTSQYGGDALAPGDYTALVRGWWSGAEPNRGLVFTKPNSSGWGEVAYLNDPELVIEYTVPCPSNPFTAAQSSAASTVYAWNQILLKAFRAQGGAPAPLARAAAMMNVGIYDVFNSIFFAKLEQLSTGTPTTETCGWEPYLVLADADPGTNAHLAAGHAAKAILTNALPSQATLIATEFATLYAGTTPQAMRGPPPPSFSG